jgi:predicted ester cyclase
VSSPSLRRFLAAALAIAPAFACGQEVHCDTPGEKANLERYRALAEQVWNGANLQRAGEFLAADFVWHDAPAGMPPGPEPMRRMIEDLRIAFPDRKVTTEFVLCADDMVMVKQQLTGTNTGPFLGRAPTGKAHRIWHSETYRFRDGRIVEQWGENPFKAVVVATGWRVAWPPDLAGAKAAPLQGDRPIPSLQPAAPTPERKP